ncbi:MAG: hypothetical protein IKF71_01320 [Bacilli bacterium]|nr:hypothetical protein [Bacilli bacterium]
MLDKFKGKTVKILVAGNSGISTSTSVAGNSTVSAIIQVFGKIVDFDKEFVELETVSVVLFNNTHTANNFADSEQTSSMLLSRDKIIGICLK